LDSIALPDLYLASILFFGRPLKNIKPGGNLKYLKEVPFKRKILKDRRNF